MKTPYIIGIAAVLLAALILIGLMTQDGRQTSPSGAAVLGGPVTIEGTIKYLDDNVTLHATTYTTGVYTIDARAERPDNLTYASDSNPDTTPPTISWISRQNQTIIEDYHSFLVFIDEPANCTLYLDGAAYTNPDKSIAALWNITSLVDGNYTTINVTCEDQAQNDGYSTQAWLVVDTPDDEEPPSEIVTIIITLPKPEIPEEPEPEEDSGASDEATDNIIPQKYEEPEEDAETTEEPSEPLAESEERQDFLNSFITDPLRFGLLLLIVIILAGAIVFLRRK
jgi:hypothetical protein